MYCDEKTTTIVALDTNVFMHFQPVGQWDWEALVSTPARVLVCAQVLRELDKHKDGDESSSKRARARAALQLAERATTEPVQLREGVMLVVSPWEPPDEAFLGQLVRDEPDDCILAAALAFRSDPSQPLVFFSNDTTPRIKARALGMRAEAPPDRLRVREDEDPRDAELRRLTDRLRAIEQTIPKPTLSFDDGSLSRAVASPDPDLLGRVPDAPDVVLQELHPLAVPNGQGGTGGESPQVTGTDDIGLNAQVARSVVEAIASMAQLMALTREQVDAYNQELAEFEHRYRDAHAAWLAYQTEMCELMAFRLVLANGGTAPAEQVEVYLRLASKHAARFALVRPETRPRRPPLPRPPVKPSRLTMGLESLAQPAFPFGGREAEEGLPVALDGAPPPRSLDFVATYSDALSSRYVSYADDVSHIRFGHRQLRHGFRMDFGPFAVRRLDGSARGCSLDYEIHADNLPTPVQGSLHLRFESSGDGT